MIPNFLTQLFASDRAKMAIIRFRYEARGPEGGDNFSGFHWDSRIGNLFHRDSGFMKFKYRLT